MGAVERPISFVDNDRPGVMLLGAAERYLARYGVAVGRDLVLFANHDRVYAAAARLAAGGMRVRAIVDTRSDAVGMDGGAAALRAELERRGTACLAAHAVVAAEGGRGVRAVRVAPLAGAGPVRRIACDTLLHSGGWSPCVQAGLQEGGAREYSPGLGAFLAAAQPQWRILCGAANGQLELGAVLADGRAAGEQAARRAGHSTEAAAAAADRGEVRGAGATRFVAFWR